MIENFLAHLRARGYAESTVEISQRWLEHFSSRHPRPPKELRPADLSRYHQSLHWEPGSKGKLYSENTVNQAVGVLKAYFRWCVEQGHLNKSPASHLVTRRVPPKERVTLTPSQVRAVLDQVSPNTFTGLRNRAVLGLLIEHQASPAALSRLNLADFQPDTGAVLLKERKRRIISVGAGLQADLERYLRLGRAGVAIPGEEAFFVSRAGKRLGPGSAGQLLANCCRKAGVPRPSFFS